MVRPSVTLFALGVVWSTALGGPNAGGTLVVHDTGIAYTDGSSMFPSPAPACVDVDNEMDVGAPAVWKVYAAFNPYSSPRLKGLAWGITITPGLTVEAGGLPHPGVDFEITQGGWPSTSGAGIGMSFGQTQTDPVIECYWFGGYAYGPPQSFGTASHPIQTTEFVDDGFPQHFDPIAGHSTIGFGQAGTTTCPDVVLPGACCYPSGWCQMLLEFYCTEAGNSFIGGECEPNPCPQPPPLGACCFTDGACFELGETTCANAGGTWFGGPCTPNPCPQPPPVGACCFSTGACSVLPEEACVTSGGTFYGGPCAPNPCPQPPVFGACCFPDGSCQVREETECVAAGGAFHGGSCVPNPCPQPPPGGPNAGGTLIVHDTGLDYSQGSSPYPSPVPDCAGVDNQIDTVDPWVWKVYAAFNPNSSPRLKGLTWGITLTPGLRVLDAGLPDPPNQFEVTQNGWPNTSGAGIGMSFVQTQTAHVVECYWFGGYAYTLPQTFGTGPHPTQMTAFVDDAVPGNVDPIAAHSAVGFGHAGLTSCPSVIIMAACCFPDGSCLLLTASDCLAWGGEVHGSTCTPGLCPQGACCLPDGQCAVLQESACVAAGGLYLGGPCTPDPCPTRGACCLPDDSCQFVTLAQCVALGGSWYGEDVPCSPGFCLPIPTESTSWGSIKARYFDPAAGGTRNER